MNCSRVPEAEQQRSRDALQCRCSHRDSDQQRRPATTAHRRPCRSRSGCGSATGSAVPRGGIRPISCASNAYISAMMAAPMTAVSNSPWRADRRAASARRECDGARTSCARREPRERREDARNSSAGTPAAGLHLTPSLRSGRSRSKSPCLARCCSRRCGSARCSAGRWLRRAAAKLRSRARLHQRKPARALPQEIRRARAVRQQRRGAGHEHEARLVEAGGGGLRSDADDVAQARARSRRSEIAASATATRRRRCRIASSIAATTAFSSERSARPSSKATRRTGRRSSPPPGTARPEIPADASA